jgi:hypothetical protein
MDRAFISSFRSSCLIKFRSPVWRDLRGNRSGLTSNLLQSRPCLCRMAVRGLAGPPHHPNGSGRDWTYKSATRTKTGIAAPVGSRPPRLFARASDPGQGRHLQGATFWPSCRRNFSSKRRHSTRSLNASARLTRSARWTLSGGAGCYCA